ncbi:MAG: non-ribosomal peptide synthetase, partial [Gammaproteobacteria bacterium]|nr:non-ribosomal peptide synthetase [Gammaproteobacteria bacterium]
ALQVVQGAVPLPWREHDWRGFSADEQRSQLKTLKQQERKQGFDLSIAPLMRFDLIRLDEQRYVFIQHFHHILMDGWCLPVLVSEVRDSYLAYLRGQTPQLPALRPYRDYIAWLRQQDHAAALKYWQQRLAGFAAKTTLPIVNNQTGTPLYRDAGYALSTADTQQLQRFSQVLRVTVNTAVQGAFALLLSRYSRESSVCFGVTVSGRHAPLSGIEQMMGLFINTLPLRIEADSD